MATISRKTTDFVDLDLNMFKVPLTKDVSKKTDEEAVKAAIKNLILTRPYERPFHPEIGSGIMGLLFEPMTVVTTQSLKRTITDVINNFEPRARLDRVDIIAKPDNNEYKVSIYFYLVNGQEIISITTFLKRLR
jgi:phage baseplate assembly protein W